MKGIVDGFNNTIKALDARISAGTTYSTGGTASMYSSGFSQKVVSADAKKAQQEKDAYIKENQDAAVQSYLYNQPDAQRSQWFGQLADYYNKEQAYQQFRGAGARIDQGIANLDRGADDKPKSKPYEKIALPTEIDDFEDEENLKTSLLSLEGQVAGIWADASEEMPARALTKMDEMSNSVDVKLNPVVNTASLKSIDFSTTIDGFNAISNAIGAIAGASDSATAAVMQWGASTLAAIGTAIPAILSLVIAKKAEATANAEAAITGAASSVAAVPVVGWIMAGAAVASIIAAFAGIPKFATGGIVPGSSYTGDRVPALVNSGEMILNAGQQANLFNLINGGGGGSGNGGGIYEMQIHGSMLTAAVGVTNKRRRL